MGLYKEDDFLDNWKQKGLFKLTRKQVSIRLRVNVEQEIMDILKKYPNVTKTDVINDLLTEGLKHINDKK